ncbi:MAG: hypothetical protein P1V36_15820, partial [Planctomycetota bacterium]|nr:hypothetical protein [Planctomycetota bacterium]
KMHPECVGLHVYLEEPGAPRTSLGVVPTGATEATLIRSFPGAMPGPGEGHKVFVIMPVNGNDRTMGTERSVPISEHHSVLAQVRRAHQMAKRQGIPFEEAEALLMGSRGGQALAAAGSGDAGGLLHVIELMRGDRAAERERQSADQAELRDQRRAVVDLIREQGQTAQEAAAAVIEQVTATNREARSNDQKMAAQSTEMLRDFAAAQITAARDGATQQVTVQRQLAEGVQTFMGSQMQMLTAAQQAEVARVRAESEARERAAERRREERESRERQEREDRQARERREREDRDRREREDRDRRERADRERQERDRAWQQQQQNMWMEQQKAAAAASERAAEIERERLAAAERERKEAAEARERDRQRSHEAEIKRVEAERSAAREHAQTLTTLQLAGMQKSGGLKETIEGVTGVIAALGVDPGNLIGGLARRVLNPETPAPAPVEGESGALKLVTRVVDGITDVARAGMIAKAQKPAETTQPPPRGQIGMNDLDDDFDWDDDDDDLDFVEPAPAPVAAAPAAAPVAAQAPSNSMSAPLPTSAPQAPAPQMAVAPVPASPGEQRLHALVGILKQAPEDAWETYITESLVGDPLAALEAVNAKGLRAIVTEGGGDDDLFTKLKGKLQANVFVPDDMRWE